MRAWLWHGPGNWTLDTVADLVPRRGAVVVGIEGAMVLSYARQVLDGSMAYALPPGPFTPGTNAVGRVVAVGEGVYHLAVGQRVYVSPHLVVSERVADPAQQLTGLTAMGSDAASVALQRDWPHGVHAEQAEAAASAVTPLEGLDSYSAAQLATLGKFLTPLGGLLRGALQPGETLIVNGASGAFGSAAVLLGLALGAERVVLAGRDGNTLGAVAQAAGDRAVVCALRGDGDADSAALRAAAGGGAEVALDLVGNAATSDSTLAVLRSLRRNGRLVMMGSSKGSLPIDFREILGNSWSVLGCFMYPAAAPARLAALVRAKLLDLSAVKVKQFPLDELDAAMDAAARGRGLDVTVLLP